MNNDLVPCKHATDHEIAQKHHFTREESGICNPCESLIALFVMKRSDAAADQEYLDMAEESRNNARARHPSNSKTGQED